MIWTCPDCGTKKQYNEEYDSYFCPKCNKWLEGACNDPKCGYCPGRPDTPVKNKTCPECGLEFTVDDLAPEPEFGEHWCFACNTQAVDEERGKE